MNIRDFFHSATFQTLLLFVASLISLIINILYGEVDFLFYFFLLGIIISPVSLLARTRKISFPNLFNKDNKEYKLTQIIQYMASMVIFLATWPSENTSIHYMYIYNVIFAVQIFMFTLSMNNKNNREDLPHIFSKYK